MIQHFSLFLGAHEDKCTLDPLHLFHPSLHPPPLRQPPVCSLGEEGFSLMLTVEEPGLWGLDNFTKDDIVGK